MQGSLCLMLWHVLGGIPYLFLLFIIGYVVKKQQLKVLVPNWSVVPLAFNATCVLLQDQWIASTRLNQAF